MAYELPPELIAQSPAPDRDGSRLMVLSRKGGASPQLRLVSDLVENFAAGDLLVRNRTRVFPARLRGRRLPGGGSLEVLLLSAVGFAGRRCWQALGRPLKRLRPGQRLEFSGGDAGAILEAEVAGVQDGYLYLAFPAGVDVLAETEKIGEVPLPPYIARPDGPTDEDMDRYQTIYAQEKGSVAAPTAGLHLTEALFAELAVRGVKIAEVVLHVGAATFLAGQPGRSAERVEPERYFVPKETREAITSCAGRVIAVGTTTTRALESGARQGWPTEFTPTDLVLKPGVDFQVVNGLLTNFHLPGSSLLSLVAAFAGVVEIRAAYELAVAERFRFYSYGDAMLIL